MNENEFVIQLISVFLIINAIILGIMAFPLIIGAVRMNPLYGVRTSEAFKSDENWYKINKYGGKVLLGLSIVWLVCGILAIAVCDAHRLLAIRILIGAGVVFIVMFLQIFIYSKKFK